MRCSGLDVTFKLESSLLQDFEKGNLKNEKKTIKTRFLKTPREHVTTSSKSNTSENAIVPEQRVP